MEDPDLAWQQTLIAYLKGEYVGTASAAGMGMHLGEDDHVVADGGGDDGPQLEGGSSSTLLHLNILLLLPAVCGQFLRLRQSGDSLWRPLHLVGRSRDRQEAV